MAKVFLDFVPLDHPGLTKLHILEGAAAGGPFSEIEMVTPVGTYPDYLTSYTTDLAVNANNWFAIQWEDNKGWVSEISQAVQGGTTTLVGEIVSRMLQRDSGVKENVALQSAQSVVELYFNADPYTIDPDDVGYNVKDGLTLLALARSYIWRVASAGTTSKYTAGLVSQEFGDTQSGFNNIDQLIAQANSILGLNVSRILLMDDIEIAGGTLTFGEDISRLLLVEIE